MSRRTSKTLQDTLVQNDRFIRRVIASLRDQPDDLNKILELVIAGERLTRANKAVLDDRRKKVGAR